MDILGSPDRVSATGADILPAAGFPGRGKLGVFIAGNQDICKPGFQDKVQQIIGRGGKCPAILGVMLHDQAVCLCNLLESLVVVGVVPGGVLDVVQIAVEMYHLMEQRGGDFLNGPCQCPGT